MKNNINQVAQTIANEISKYPANASADHGTLHHTLKMTKRESEANLMAGWFLKKVEKIIPDNSDEEKEEYNQLRQELVELAIEIVGK